MLDLASSTSTAVLDPDLVALQAQGAGGRRSLSDFYFREIGSETIDYSAIRIDDNQTELHLYKAQAYGCAYN